MGIVAYSLLWVMQDLDHQPYECSTAKASKSFQAPGSLCGSCFFSVLRSLVLCSVTPQEII